MAAIRGMPSSLWQGDGSSLRGSALNRQVLCWRGDSLRSLVFCQSKREKESLLPPQGRVAGREDLLWQGEAGDLQPLESWDNLGPHWRDVFSSLEHNCQWKSLSTDFSAQKHCGLGRFGEDF